MVDNSEAYGEPLADRVEETLGDAWSQRDKTEVGQTDFAPTISKMESAQPDAVFYGGYIAEAAPLLKQMRDAGIDAPFVGGDGLYGADFGNAVGDAGEGAVVMCPCAPIDERGHLRCRLRGGVRRRAGRLRRRGLRRDERLPGRARRRCSHPRGRRGSSSTATRAEGLSKEITFDENGDVPQENVSYWAYKNEGGTLVPEVEVTP